MGAERGVVHWLAVVLLPLLALAGDGSRAQAEERPLPPKSSEAAAAPAGAADKSAAGIGIDGLQQTAVVNKTKPRNAASQEQNEPDQPPQLRLGIKTQKSVQVTEPAKPMDCDNEDDCRDYSGLPKPAHANSGLKGIRKPFLGLSITAPLPW